MTRRAWLREAWEERAAILEFDAGLTRAQAECRAAQSLADIRFDIDLVTKPEFALWRDWLRDLLESGGVARHWPHEAERIGRLLDPAEVDSDQVRDVVCHIMRLVWAERGMGVPNPKHARRSRANEPTVEPEEAWAELLISHGFATIDPSTLPEWEDLLELPPPLCSPTTTRPAPPGPVRVRPGGREPA